VPYWFLGSLVLHTDNGKQVELKWISESDAARVRAAWREAHRRAEIYRQDRQNREAQLVPLRNRFRELLVRRWGSYPEAMAAWKTLLRPTGPAPGAAASSWLQAHISLPLPAATESERSDIGSEQFLPVARPDASWEYPETTRLRERMEAFLSSTLCGYDQAMADWKAAFGRGLYVSDRDRRQWLLPHAGVPRPEDLDGDVAASMPKRYRRVLDDLCRALRKNCATVGAWNATFVRSELTAWQGFFDGFETYPLSPAQREAVVHDEDNNLVLAGAGTGKTSTIAGKVGYLLKRGLVIPEEVLLLAFTRKAAEELRERIERLFQVPVTVRTFHALGLEIIGAATRRRPALCKESEDQKAKRDLLARLAEELMATDQWFAEVFVAYQAYSRTPYRSAWDFGSYADYCAYLKCAETISLKGERLRSLEEVEIANFLTLNGIGYQYEAPFKVDTATPSRRRYKPDFFLQDHAIYIEHFGVDEAGRPPPWYPPRDRQRYVEDMEWKRRVHREYGTVLIETYSWQRRQGTLLSALRTHLEQAGVPLRPVSGAEVLKALNDLGVIDPFHVLVGTFLSLFKSGGHTVEEVGGRVRPGSDTDRFNLFLRLFDAIHRRYAAELASRNEIDFDDMIVRATGHVRRGEYRSRFRYIIVDEFQDIARGRADLILALRDQVAGCKLFCVGDDWQSIYRFSGSDVSLMTRFEQYFGPAKRTALETTFRFPDRLARFTSTFVLKNPAQLPKALSTHRADARPPVTVYLADGEVDLLPRVLGEIATETGPKRSLVFVLNRYRFQAKGADYRHQLARDFPTLDVQFLTAHTSKGREADYVVVDNLCSGRYGFPTEITDDPILSLVLAHPDACPHAEERRLFYVALTRSRNCVSLIADAGRLSCFVEEILADCAYEKVIAVGGKRVPDKCPCCGRGWLLERESVNGLFFACSNSPACPYIEDACPECRKGRAKRNDNLTTRCDVCGWGGRVCPSCQRGLLVPRSGPYGPFLGCSLFRVEVNSCSHTESLAVDPKRSPIVEQL
jgi:DNA helicase-4